MHLIGENIFRNIKIFLVNNKLSSLCLTALAWINMITGKPV